MKRHGIIDVDTHGMRLMALSRGLGALLLELLQNAVDEAVTRVVISVGPTDIRGQFAISASDDSPDGFVKLADSYMLYAPSKKRGDATKRGRFNVGEKFVIAACEWAQIVSTTGGVRFDDDGRHQLRTRRAAGTEFTGVIRTNKVQVEEALALLRQVIVPEGVVVTVNEEELPHREPMATVEATLPTLLPDAENVMRPSARKTTVRIYRPLAGEKPTLYERGLPVVETSDAFHVDIDQRVPLNQDRDNVPPAYLRAVRVIVLNAVTELGELTGAEAASVWVKQAAGDKNASDAAIRNVLDLKYGPKRVSYDPSDPEANKRAVAAGYAVVHGRSLSPDEWTQARRAEAIVPAGQVTPSNRWESSNDPNAPSDRYIDTRKWTAGMSNIAAFAIDLAKAILGINIAVKMLNEPIAHNNVAAAYGGGVLTFNVGVLGYAWFTRPRYDAKIISLIVHELAHHHHSDHLSDGYTHECTDLGGKVVQLAIEQPDLFTKVAGEQEHPLALAGARG